MLMLLWHKYVAGWGVEAVGGDVSAGGGGVGGDAGQGHACWNWRGGVSRWAAH